MYNAEVQSMHAKAERQLTPGSGNYCISLYNKIQVNPQDVTSLDQQQQQQQQQQGLQLE